MIVAYRAQKIKFLQRLLIVSRELKGLPSVLATVLAIDDFRSRENEVIILDIIVTMNLSFLNNEERMNVAFTRAKANPIIVDDVRILFQRYLRDWKNIKGESQPQASPSRVHARAHDQQPDVRSNESGL